MRSACASATTSRPRSPWCRTPSPFRPRQPPGVAGSGPHPLSGQSGLRTECRSSPVARRAGAALVGRPLVDRVGRAGPPRRRAAGRPARGRAGAGDDVAEAYARCDVAVSPLQTASGTRIKVLEAMAHRRPVVTTTDGVAGIEGVPGRDFLLADRPEEFARHIAALRVPGRSDRLVADAAALVARLYDATSIIESAGRLLHGVTTPGAGPVDAAASRR